MATRGQSTVDNSSRYRGVPVCIVSYRSVVARFNDVQPHSLPLPVIEYPSLVRYVSYNNIIFSEKHKLIIGDVFVLIIFRNAVLSV